MGVKEMLILFVILAIGYWLGSSGVISKYIPSV